MDKEQLEYLLGELDESEYLVVIKTDNYVDLHTNLDQDTAASIMDILKDHFQLAYVPGNDELADGRFN